MLSDAECCDIVDGMDAATRYAYTELKARTEGAATYKAAAANIQATLAKHRDRREGRAGT